MEKELKVNDKILLNNLRELYTLLGKRLTEKNKEIGRLNDILPNKSD